MIKFVNVKYDSVIPDPKNGAIDYASTYPFAASDLSFVSDVNALLVAYVDAMDHQKIRAGLLAVMQLSSRGNLFIQENRLDNALLASNPSRCAEVVLLTVNLIYTLASIVQPFMPSTSDAILAQLDATPRSIPDAFEIDLLPGHTIGTASHLFTRIDPKNVPVWRAQYGGDSVVNFAQSAVAAGQESKAAQKAAKKAKMAADKAGVPVVARTEEQVALDARIKEQGDVVRRIKLREAKEGEDVAVELEKLKALKGELDVITKALAAAAL